MDAEAVLKHRVRNEQTSGEKKSPSKGVIIFKFFPARTQIFRQIGQTFELFLANWAIVGRMIPNT